MATISITREMKLTSKDLKIIQSAKPTPLLLEILKKNTEKKEAVNVVTGIQSWVK